MDIKNAMRTAHMQAHRYKASLFPVFKRLCIDHYGKPGMVDTAKKMRLMQSWRVNQ